MTNQRTLVLPEPVYDDLTRVVESGPTGCETGAHLFGVGVGRDSVALAIAGPGPHAMHQENLYASDHQFASGVYQALLSALPSIRWLGELHLHPDGVRELSALDRRSAHAVLDGTMGGNVRPSTVIDGVIQLHAGELEILPVRFTRSCPDGEPLRVSLVPADAEVVRHARRRAARIRSATRQPREGAPTSSENNNRLTLLARAWSIFRRKRP